MSAPSWSAARREVLVAALGGTDSLARTIATAGARGAYLARAVLTGRIPTEAEVERDHIAFAENADLALAAIEHDARRGPRRMRTLPVRVVAGTVVDVTDSASSPFTTGIQRVAREVVAAWSTGGGIELGAFTRDGSFRTLTGAESERAGSAAAVPPPALLVPDGAAFCLPEIATERGRALRLAAVARYGSRTSIAVGHDCIPITTAQTAPPGMPGAFAGYLAALARFDRVAVTSGASFAEFAGWAAMLPAAGLTPPVVELVELPFAPLDVEPEPEAEVRAALGLGGARVVLVVGSHEPRKNHLTILTAAELAWRAGSAFRLVLAGGRSWDAAEFDALVARLRAAGRPIELVVGVSDARLAGLYALAEVSVFASFNEGYGLPVAESIAAGTPVITADYGSQRELGLDRGAILVDPTDPRAIAGAITAVLDEDSLRQTLAAEAGRSVRGSWPDYAARLGTALRR